MYMKNEYLLTIEGRLHGYHTRLKELHYSAPSYSLHKIIDEFDSELQEFDDTIMEDAQSVFGFIEPGMINPVLPEETEIVIPRPKPKPYKKHLFSFLDD